MRNLLFLGVVSFCFLFSNATLAQEEFSLKLKNISFFDGTPIDAKKVQTQAADSSVIKLIQKIARLQKEKINFKTYAAPVGMVVAFKSTEGKFLLYDPSFLPEGGQELEKSWQFVGVLAHQMGHLVDVHNMDKNSLPEEVLKADRFSAFVQYRLGADELQDVNVAIREFAIEEGTKTHPARDVRLKAFAEAFVEARQLGRAMNSPDCPGFAETANPDDAVTQYVLYRDQIKLQNYDQAYKLWQEVYQIAPAADGRRNTIISDGIFLYQHFYRQSQDAQQKKEYIGRIFELYDRIASCYPNEKGYALGRKGFDLFFQYPDQASSRKEIYDLLKAAIDLDGMETDFFVLNPFSSLLVEMYGNEEISLEEAQTYQQKVRDILAKGLAECKGSNCEPWQIIEEYAPVRLEAFESIRGFYDFEYYIDKYFPDYLLDSTSCESVTTVYSRLVWGNTPADDPRFVRLVNARKSACVTAGTQLLREAYQCLQNADYDCAIEKFEAASNETDDVEKKANYLLLVGKVYQAHKKNFPKAREYARKAIEIRPDWGDPYMLIGTLYASSGPLCGPGRGWDSQVVTWVAIDKWRKAKQVDPSVSEEANRLIGRYRQYMPAVGDIFQRTLKEGQRFYVPCWIQEWTTIRAAPK